MQIARFAESAPSVPAAAVEADYRPMVVGVVAGGGNDDVSVVDVVVAAIAAGISNCSCCCLCECACV